mmetsp:Transcript_27300/g.45134  ORF Transcript_27300/g.45134 Transcript_27300/m.45134 type:complete len:82 (-) Transcript_27300:179-424(-)
MRHIAQQTASGIEKWFPVREMTQLKALIAGLGIHTMPLNDQCTVSFMVHESFKVQIWVTQQELAECPQKNVQRNHWEPQMN